MNARHLRLMVGTVLCLMATSNVVASDGNGFVEFRVIGPQKLYSPHTVFPKDPAYLVIRSSAEWIAYWSAPGRLLLPVSPGVPADPAAHVTPPDVDFDQYTLLAVSTGPKPSSGYAVTISSIIRKQARGMVVSVLDVGPGGNQCAVLSTVSYPMVFALISKTEEPIRFQISEVKTDCNNPPRTIDTESGAADLHRKAPLTQDLRDAPERVVIENAAIGLQAFPLEDRMPRPVSQDPNTGLAKPDNRPLHISFRLISQNGTPLPSGLRAQTIWILQGDQIWKTEALEETVGASNRSSRDFLVNGGPAWRSMAPIDVIIRLVDGKGAVFLLAARHQRIQGLS